MRGDIEVNQLPPTVAKNDEREKDPKCCRWHRKEINTDDVAEVIIQKCAPGRGLRPSEIGVRLHGALLLTDDAQEQESGALKNRLHERRTSSTGVARQ